MATATTTKKEEAYPWKAGASSRHTKNLKQSILRLSISMNGTAHFKKNVNNCLNTNIYSYLETSGGQSSNL
jgi:hypothetical protein